MVSNLPLKTIKKMNLPRKKCMDITCAMVQIVLNWLLTAWVEAILLLADFLTMNMMCFWKIIPLGICIYLALIISFDPF